MRRRQRIARLESLNPWTSRYALCRHFFRAYPLCPRGLPSEASGRVLCDQNLPPQRPFQSTQNLQTFRSTFTRLKGPLTHSFRCVSLFQKTGEICLDLLKNAWSAVYTLQAVCRAIINLLAHPEADSPLNCDCGNLLRSGDTRGYNSMAKMYARLYGSVEHSIQGETN